MLMIPPALNSVHLPNYRFRNIGLQTSYNERNAASSAIHLVKASSEINQDFLTQLQRCHEIVMVTPVNKYRGSFYHQPVKDDHSEIIKAPYCCPFVR